MRQHIDLMSSKKAFKGMSYSLMTLTFLCLSVENAYSDSTYFPEDMETTDAGDNDTTAENSGAKEWAELSPPKKKTAEVTPVKEEKKKEVSVVESPAPKLEKGEIQKPKPSVAAIKPSSAPTSDPKTKLVSEKQQPSKTPTPLVAPIAAAPTTTPPTSITSAAKEPQPLQLTTVEPRSKAVPVKDQPTAQNVVQKTVLSYSEVANDRPPLGILEHGQEVHNQKWYLYSSAIRGLKNPSDKLQVVIMEGSPPNRGEEIRDLLVEMGIEPEKIQLIHGTGEENHKGMTYIFAGK